MDADQPPDQVEDELSIVEYGVESQTRRVKGRLDGFEGSIQDLAIQRLREDLTDLRSAIGKIPSPTPPPKTTLQLQNLADVEGAWQNYLAYFLDPDANHGLGKDPLIQFLQGLDRLAQKNIPTRISDDVKVDSEVGSPNDNRPDIVIQEAGTFYVCCELKLYASEGNRQTIRYVEDEYIGSTPKSEYPENGRHYLYIRRPDRPGPDASEFVDVTWRQVRNWLQPLVLENQGRYPSRAMAQLTDFIDTIHRDMTQEEHMQTAQEKMELYFNHEDAIREAEEALDTVYEYEVENWRRRFLEQYLPENWGPNWHINSNRYGQIYHSTWRRDGDLAIDGADIEMHLVHLIRNKESFTDGTLTMQLRWPGESPYRERFKELFLSQQFEDELDARLAEHDIEKKADYSYANPRFIEKIYPVVKTDLPESYYETLQTATREHLEVAPVINEILETAIDDVEQSL